MQRSKPRVGSSHEAAPRPLLSLSVTCHGSSDQRRTIKQMHADLAALGYDGSYNRVAAFARVWRARKEEAEKTAERGTFVPLVFAPCEAFQFDWSEDWAVLGGERTKLQVAQFKLSYSRAFIVRAYRPARPSGRAPPVRVPAFGAPAQRETAAARPASQASARARRLASRLRPWQPW